MSRVLNNLPEAFVSHTAISRAVSREVGAGRIRKLASRLYTKNLEDSPERLVQRNLWSIVAGYFPGALLADRTAFEAAPAHDGSLCLITDRGRAIELPGAVLRPRRGPGPIASDMPFLNGLRVSSRARAFLENMRTSRARRNRVSRTLSRAEVEERLDRLIRVSGETEVLRLRDDAREVGEQLGMNAEVERLDALIGTLLGTRRSQLDSPVGLARSRGSPFDPDRMELLHSLHRSLRHRPPSFRPTPSRSASGRATLAFYEAYFSNFVEGTKFLVEEADRIVFNGEIPRDRPADAHDVLGTWGIVSDSAKIGRTPRDPADLVAILRARHRAVMVGRPETLPGRFKTKANQAGLTEFVAPDLVLGTLAEGFALYRSLESAFERAAYIMFLVSEVHPFADGNGRVARIMMNAELSAGGEERIVVPTVFLNNYIVALRALSRTANPEPLIQVLDYLQRWTVAVRWSSVQETQRELEACNAFLESDETGAMGVRLRMPRSVGTATGSGATTG